MPSYPCLVSSLHELIRDTILDASRAAALRASLERDGSRGFRRFDRILRSRTAYARVGLKLTEFSALLDGDIAALSTPLLACLSMQRDGFLRERAVALLAQRYEPIALASIVNRIADPVPQVAARAHAAWHALHLSLQVPHLVWCLPVLDFVYQTPRGAASGFQAEVDAFLLRHAEQTLHALEEATRASDQHLRLSAFAQLARLFPSALVPRLPEALNDSSPPVRLWAARTTFVLVPAGELEPLLHLLAQNRSPSLRLLALREFRRRANADAIEAACLDGNANVRFYARRYLRKLQRVVEHRDTALAILCNPTAATARTVGALAILSEFGRPQDRSIIAQFADDARVSVAAEARRTLDLLR